MKQYQWMPADSGNWFEVDPQGKLDEEETELELRRVLSGPQRQVEGCKVRVREVGEWSDYVPPVDPQDILSDLKAYLQHNPSSSFKSKEIVQFIEHLEQGGRSE